MTNLDHVKLELGVKDVQAYLRLSPRGGKVTETLRLLDFLGYADGPDVYFDFSIDGGLLGIECLMFAPRATKLSRVAPAGKYWLRRVGSGEVALVLPTAPVKLEDAREVTDLYGVLPGVGPGKLFVVRDAENILAELRYRS